MGTAETEEAEAGAASADRGSGTATRWLAVFLAGGLMLGGSLPLQAQSPAPALPEAVVRPGDLTAQDLSAREAPKLSVVPAVGTALDATVPVRLGQRQFLTIAVVVLGVVLALLWWRGRRLAGPVEPEAPPAPLRPTASGQDDSMAVVLPGANVDAPQAPSGSAAPAGYAPPTVQARAAMKAGEVKAQAIRAAAPPPDSLLETSPGTAAEEQAGPKAVARVAAQGATSGDESAAAAHPVVQALRNSNLPLFELLFGELTGLRGPQLQRVVYGGQGEDLLVVCRAIGVEKLLFGSIFLLTDPLRGGDADEDPVRAEEVLRMYDRLPPAVAREVLARWQRRWGYDVLMSGGARADETSLG